MNVSWALDELTEFVRLTATYSPAGSYWDKNVGSEDQIVEASHVTEAILGSVLPEWRSLVSEDTDGLWTQHRKAAIRAMVALRRQDELDQNLGEVAPEMSVRSMHPWIWDAARSLWASGHYRQAVTAAGVKVNAESQNKLGRRDISETDLFKQAFSAGDASADAPRLRLPNDDGGKTAQSVRRGVMAFAEGTFAAIRNPASHDHLVDISEAEALEQLAAFSLLARWVDSAVVDR